MNNIDFPALIKSLDQAILASSGTNSLDEILKLLLIKLYDEIDNKNKYFNQKKFSNPSKFLKQACKAYPNIIENTQFKLNTSVLNICLEKIKDLNIFSQNAEIFDTAIEYLLPHTHRGSRGQFMTPRHITSEIISMLSPKTTNTLIDPACGSGGFLEYSILFQPPLNRESYTKNKIFGIDYDNNMARIARLVCLRVGRAESNITTGNSLTTKTKDFDIVVSNPPYGGKILEKEILHDFNLARNARGDMKPTSRHILFLEKCIDITKPGGKIALILPQGALNNSGMDNVHNHLFNNCRILAIISLPSNTFMPHTNVKTCIVILQRFKTKKNNYDVFMEVSKKSGKDLKGKIIFKNGKIDHDITKIRKDFLNFVKDQKIEW